MVFDLNENALRCVFLLLHLLILDEKNSRLEMKEDSTNMIWNNILMDSMPGLAYIFTKEGNMVAWNKRVENILGYSSIQTGGYAAPSIGDAITNIRMGNAYYQGRGDQTGIIDLSGDVFWGHTALNPDVVINSFEEDCCYGDN